MRVKPALARLRLAACGGLAAWALMAAPPALAAPADALDPVSRLLQERGLIPAATNTPAPSTGSTGPTGIAPVGAAAPGPDPTGAASTTAAGLARQVRDGASDMVLAAMNFLGVPYKRGGTSADTGFDCSGFTRHIFEMSLGLVLPRRADDQANAPGLFSIAKSELKPGDLVFFNTLRRTFSHVGIYIGDGKFIHSPRAGYSVRVEDMRLAYWQQRFTGARRVDAQALPLNGPGPAPGSAADPLLRTVSLPSGPSTSPMPGTGSPAGRSLEGALLP